MTPSSDEAFDFDMAAAYSLQANTADVHMMLKLLVRQLADVLGKRLVFERAGGLLRRSDEVRSVELSLGDDVLRAEVDGASLRCTSVTVRAASASAANRSTWTNGSPAPRALQAEAAHSEPRAVALENIVIGGHT